MQTHLLQPAPPTEAPLVIALHCSGGSSRQWRKLADRLPANAALLAPELLGAPAGPVWDGARPFTLADEAAAIVAAIDDHRGPVHLVGHSFGGGVALRAAADRPERVASLSLYEPTAFHMLKRMGASAGPAFLEIVTVAADIRYGLTSGAYQAATALFVEYWNGAGTWANMKPELRADLMRYLPKVCLDFNALIGDTTPLAAYSKFAFPVLVMRGAEGPEPTRLIAERLTQLAEDSRLVTLPGAGHMGPLSHGETVADLIVDNIAQAMLQSASPRQAAA